MKIVIELKKIYQVVKQLSSLEKLIENLEEDYTKIFIDINCIKQEELEEILKIKQFNLYLICEDKNQINEYLKLNSVMILEKPLDKELLKLNH